MATARRASPHRNRRFLSTRPARRTAPASSMENTRPASSVILEISSDSDDSARSPPKVDLTTPPPSPPRKRPRTPSPASEGEITDEEGELTPEAEKAQVAAQINKDLQKGGRDVMQKDARYFMIDNVVCSHCGVKGHLSYDCPEEEVQSKCYLCGKPSHPNKPCPDQVCYICRKSGHRYKDCPQKNSKHAMGKRTEKRKVAPPRQPTLYCYVCGKGGHLDCSLETQPIGLLSCCNCGLTGHTSSSCTQPNVDRVINVVLELERERKNQKRSSGAKPPKPVKKKSRQGKPLKAGKNGKNDNGSSEAEGGSSSSKDGEDKRNLAKLSSEEYRKILSERIRARRYSR